jgi:hypothetical protein
LVVALAGMFASLTALVDVTERRGAACVNPPRRTDPGDAEVGQLLSSLFHAASSLSYRALRS